MGNDHVKENKEKHREKSSLGREERQLIWRRLHAPCNIKARERERDTDWERKESTFIFFSSYFRIPKSLEGNPTIGILDNSNGTYVAALHRTVSACVTLEFSEFQSSKNQKLSFSKDLSGVSSRKFWMDRDLAEPISKFC